MLLKFKIYILAHKFIVVVVLLVAFYGGYRGYKTLTDTSSEIRYVFGEVKKQTIIASIQGSGQVSASNQVDIQPKASGEITALSVTLGQEVGAGALLATIDASDALRAVRDAETALETAKLELDKMLEPLDELTLLQAENSLAQAKNAKQNAEDNITKAYEDGFNTVSNAFLVLPNVMAGLADILFGSNAGLDSTTQNIDYYARVSRLYDEVKAEHYRTDAENTYLIARAAYDKSFGNYKLTNRASGAPVIEVLVVESYGAVRDIAEAVKSTTNLAQFYKEKLMERNIKYATVADTHLASLNSYTGTTNSNLSNLLAIQSTLKSSREALIDAGTTIKERELSLAKTKEGPDDLDVRAKKITIQQRADALTTAKEALAEHYVRAPFAGMIAKLNAQKGDTASAGTAIVTLVTKQKIAEISLNEIDVAKVKAGQKVTLTFDAVPGLSISGVVAEVDAVGTVTQGVVNYGLKIGFDTNDDRVKSGMSVSAAIITDIKQDVIAVPASAVKSLGNTYSVQVIDVPGLPVVFGQTVPQQGVLLPSTPREVAVEIGLSNDILTEIISGLQEGETVVTRTVTPSTGATTQAPSLFGGGGGGRALR